MIRVRILISGKVTGVFFRAFIREKALSLCLNGLARNLDDETVEAVFEGDEINIKKMIEYCKNGPSGAIIKDVKVIKEKVKGEKSFVIK